MSDCIDMASSDVYMSWICLRSNEEVGEIGSLLVADLGGPSLPLYRWVTARVTFCQAIIYFSQFFIILLLWEFSRRATTPRLTKSFVSVPSDSRWATLVASEGVPSVFKWFSALFSFLLWFLLYFCSLLVIF